MAELTSAQCNSQRVYHHPSLCSLIQDLLESQTQLTSWFSSSVIIFLFFCIFESRFSHTQHLPVSFILHPWSQIFSVPIELSSWYLENLFFSFLFFSFASLPPLGLELHLNKPVHIMVNILQWSSRVGLSITCQFFASVLEISLFYISLSENQCLSHL